MDRTLVLASAEAKKYGVDADFVRDEALPSFEVRWGDGRLVIAAPSPIETLYGVYECAELFGGYTFFEPGRDRFDPSLKVNLKELAKDKGNVLLPARRPLLKRRGFIQEFPFDDETAMLFDWMAKNKLNYLLVWMKYYDELSDELKEMAAVRGIDIESGHHNFDYWIPGKVYGKTHPEFFAEINGKRITPSGNSALLLSEQLCTTNPELRAELARRMLEYCDRHPEVKTISLVPNDGFGWCECKECSRFYDKSKKGDFYSLSEHVYKADRIYHDLVRDISARVNKVRPDIQITFCAYINYCRPSEGMVLKSGMAVHFADYWRCINHEISDESCPINSHYADDIRAWCAVKQGGDVNIYEYFMGVNFYLSLPMVHFHEMFHEMKWYGETGVDGILTQFHIPHWSVYGVNYYFMARAARGDAETEVITRTMRRLFGPDAQQGHDFYNSIKTLLLTMGRCHIPYPYSLFRRTKPEDYQRLHAQARALAALAPDDRFRQELVLWMEYLCRFKAFFDLAQAQKATVQDAQNLLEWIHSHGDKRIFVLSRFDDYFEAIKTAIKTGRRWIHFNLDWEDDYILRQVEVLQ
ncbi:MAG: DUF4838 domain-containing protein [Victivallales bacterium]|nr:DUF4838 domain-containing protein [Victivallales bacterium]